MAHGFIEREGMMDDVAMTIIDEAKNEYIARWHCCECHKTDISGGIRQASKTRGVAGHCYWCFKPVDVYFGRCRKPPNADLDGT